MELKTNIQEIPVLKTINVVRIDFVTISFSGVPYAKAYVTMLDNTGAVIDSKYVTFTKEELDSWGEDDSTVLSLVVPKLGLN